MSWAPGERSSLGVWESFSGLASKMFIAHKTVNLSSKDVKAGHGGRAGGCLTYKLCRVLIALNMPGHKNTNDSRLSSFPIPSLLSFWHLEPWLFLLKVKWGRLGSLKSGILSLGQPDALTNRPSWFSKVSTSHYLGLTLCLPPHSAWSLPVLHQPWFPLSATSALDNWSH